MIFSARNPREKYKKNFFRKNQLIFLHFYFFWAPFLTALPKFSGLWALIRFNTMDLLDGDKQEQKNWSQLIFVSNFMCIEYRDT